MSDFCPRWYTTDDFIERKAINVFHKENERLDINSDITNYHILARSSFTYDGEGDVRLFASADDCYKLYINGSFVCQGSAPSFYDNYYYNVIDIKDYLIKGENVIAFHLYYQGLINRVWVSGDNRFGIGAIIFCGSEKANLTFKYKRTFAYSGDILGYDTAFLENFDSSLWENEWSSPDYDDSDWADMIEVPCDYTFIKQPTRLLDVYEIKPYNINIINNTYYIDIGTEISGTLNLTAKGRSGDKIIIRYAEELKDDASLRYELRANCTYEEVWTLGKGESYFNGYFPKGFRYVEIVAGDSRLDDIKIICCHYPFDDSYCNVSFSDSRLNSIFELCKNTIKYGVQESFIDCPTRERGQYLGDAFISGHAHALLTGSYALLEKCVDDFARTASVCDGLLAVAPCSLCQEIADYSLIFGELVLLAYSFNKDKNFLRRYYNIVKNIIIYFKQYERADGLLEQVADKWNMVDWPENLRDGYDFDLSRPVADKGVHNVINAYYIGAIKTLCKIEAELGIDYSFDYEALEQSYINVFFMNGLFVDSELSVHSSLHSNAFALYFDLVPDEYKRSVADFIYSKGFECGAYVSYFVLKGLASVGEKEKAFELIVNDSEHGWLNMLREGATTCFEVWGKEQKWNTSLCHPWATAPIIIMLEDLTDYVIPHNE